MGKHQKESALDKLHRYTKVNAKNGGRTLSTKQTRRVLNRARKTGEQAIIDQLTGKGAS
jgi:hypothetical protein